MTIIVIIGLLKMKMFTSLVCLTIRERTWKIDGDSFAIKILISKTFVKSIIRFWHYFAEKIEIPSLK